MVEKEFALWRESMEPFDFGNLKGKELSLFIGIPVKIDKVIYDLTGREAMGVSGTFVTRGVKTRGVWDLLGNIVNLKNNSIFQFGWEKGFTAIYSGIDVSMLKLVSTKKFQDYEGV